MKTTLKTDITIRDICEGFVYNELEGKGLFGLNGKLTIQPEYQRNYIYADGKKDVAVIDSVLKGYPLGLIYFNQVGDRYEVLDGQQRITSLGRFLTHKLAIKDKNGMQQYIDGLNEEDRNKVLNTKLLIYICEGTESEIKDWFQTVNIPGVNLNNQEKLNAIYSGPFVSKLKEEFSNSENANIQKWKCYVKGSANRQDFLERALQWVSQGNVESYMSLHRQDTDIMPVRAYFNAVIDWVSAVFSDVLPEMRGLEWGRLYEEYHNKPYNVTEVSKRVHELYADPYVTNHKGIFEYILGNEQDKSLLNIRVFDRATINQVYTKQTQAAKEKGVSNCPDCALQQGSNSTRIYKQSEMEADHVTAWSKGGATDESNCQMLCRHHNRSKGNK
ncbi:MAG: DUF262 domain-containing protein [Bacteroidales bacterium]|nr:DUF262 domain-containing protein [Bacteroidales bacterium]